MLKEDPKHQNRSKIPISKKWLYGAIMSFSNRYLSNVSYTTLTRLLHNFNNYFLRSTIGYIFLHVSYKYPMVDLKKKLLELCKS
jgi:hypothetical protein